MKPFGGFTSCAQTLRTVPSEAVNGMRHVFWLRSMTELAVAVGAMVGCNTILWVPKMRSFICSGVLKFAFKPRVEPPCEVIQSCLKMGFEIDLDGDIGSSRALAVIG